MSFINHPDKIPDTPSKIKEYFHGRYRPNAKAMTIWPDIKIGFNTEEDSFFEDCSALLGEKGEFGLYKKDIQAEETEEVGFLLFSTQQHDKKRLRTAIIKRTEETYKFKPELSLRWRKVMDPTTMRKGQGKAKSNEKPIKALYIEVIKGTGTKISRSLAKMYSTTLANPPDMEKMRFIPSPQYAQNIGIHEKYSELISRQSWFLKFTSRMTSYEIAHLDIPSDKLRCTMRQMIMEMKNRHNKPLFLTVDKAWSGGVIFTFPKQYEDDASNRIADIGSYLHFKEKSDYVLIKNFTPEAAQRALDSPWNEKEQRAISTLDNFLDDAIKECDNIEWMKRPTVEIELPVSIQQNNNTDDREYNIQPGLFNHAPDDDASLNTFGNHSGVQKNQYNGRNDENKIPPVTPPKLHVNNKYNNKQIEMDELTFDDSITMDTMNSRMTALEEGLDQVKNLSNQVENLLRVLGKGGVMPGLATLQQGPKDPPVSEKEQGDMP